LSNRVTLKGVPQRNGEYQGLKSNILVDAPPTAAEYSVRIVDMPVDTPSLINRDTEIKNLKKNLKVRGGFDGQMWQAPRAGRINATGETFIFDGDHSKHLFKLTYPDAKTMPMQVIDVNNKEEIHKLFVQTNKTCKTLITAEQTFVHNVRAGEESVKKYTEILCGAGMYVYCSNEDGGKVGDQSGVEIRFNHLHSIVGIDLSMVADAKNLIMKCKNPLGPKNTIPGWLLRSLCLIFSAYPDLRPEGKCGTEFEEFFLDAVGNRIPERYGRNVERDCRSGVPKSYRMAAGIVQEIVDHQKDQPGSFEAVSRGQYKRLMLSDLRRLAEERTNKKKRSKN
jgi:hypothetical protein